METAIFRYAGRVQSRELFEQFGQSVIDNMGYMGKQKLFCAVFYSEFDFVLTAGDWKTNNL